MRRNRVAYVAALTLAFAVVVASAQVYAENLELKDRLTPDGFANTPVLESDAQVPVGTKITLTNWMKYKNFMSFGMQTLFQRTSHWQMPDDVELDVGPTTQMPLPKTFLGDTEKYSKNARLVQKPNGGFQIAGYVAGLPFPRPEGPNAGVEVLYDQYYAYIPFRAYNYGWAGWTIDRFGNKTQSASYEIWYKWNHLSEPGMPQVIAGHEDIYITQGVVVWAPEESKYTSLLQIFYDDPARNPETYVFVPALRRSLRLSAAARCSPALGTDFVEDDFRGMNIQPPIFRAKLLAKEYVLAMTNQTPAYKDPKNYYQPVFLPKPIVGKWENRPVWVIDAQRVPSLEPGYCYSHRIAYIDRQTLQVLHADIYDAEGKFYKSNEAEFFPMKHPEGGVVLGVGGPGDGKFTMYDFQNGHATHGLQFEGAINDAAPHKFWDSNLYGTPAGLAQIMK